MALPQPIRERLQTEAAIATGREICGALIGSQGVVREARPLSNRSPHPTDSFLIDAADVLRMEQMAEASGQQLLGFYHSHPGGSAQPSTADLEQALPGYIYLIIAGDCVAAWRLRDDRSGFDLVE